MSNDNQSAVRSKPLAGFWRSRAGIILIAFLTIGGLLLVYEHRVHVFAGGGPLIGLLAFCIVMHLFMHGSHGTGGHGGHGAANGNEDER